MAAPPRISRHQSKGLHSPSSRSLCMYAMPYGCRSGSQESWRLFGDFATAGCLQVSETHHQHRSVLPAETTYKASIHQIRALVSIFSCTRKLCLINLHRKAPLLLAIVPCLPIFHNVYHYH